MILAAERACVTGPVIHDAVVGETESPQCFGVPAALRQQPQRPVCHHPQFPNRCVVVGPRIPDHHLMQVTNVLARRLDHRGQDLRRTGARYTAVRAGPSDRDQRDGRVEKTEIAGIGGDHMLPGAARADHHMGIDDVRCPARCQQPADIRRIHPVEVRDISRWLTNQAGQPDLPLRPPDSLG